MEYRPISRAMKTKRKAVPCAGTDTGHFYVEHNYIEVYGTPQASNTSGTTAVRITRRQLEQSLDVMDCA